MIRISDRHAPRLLRMAPERLAAALAEEIAFGAQAIVDIARHNINDGAISGSGHVPGPPGGYPNSDTHELEQSLHVGEVVETPAGVKAFAIADAPHAAYVQRGTSRAEPRPYMDTATEEARPNVVEALVGRVREVRGG